VETNGSNTKNHFVHLYTGSTIGYTASNKIFYGDYNTGTINPTGPAYGDSYQSILVNGTEYWIHLDTGSATTGCCTDVVGINMPNR
jgi:hypothetical protein